MFITSYPDYCRNLQASAQILLLPTHTIPRLMPASWNTYLKACMGPPWLAEKNIYIYTQSSPPSDINLSTHHISYCFPAKALVPHFTHWNYASRANLGLRWSPMFPEVSNRSSHKVSNMYVKLGVISSHGIITFSCWKGHLKSSGSILSFYKHDSKLQWKIMK